MLVQLQLLRKQNDGIADSIAGDLFFVNVNTIYTSCNTAQNNRADLQAALISKEVSQNNVRLASNRAIDLGLVSAEAIRR